MAPKKSKQEPPEEVQLDDPQDFTHPALSLLDASLRCPLCYELLKTPAMLTSCSHSFCSLCIREALSNKKECPVDHTAADEGRLRTNKSLGEVVQAWTAARSALLTLQSFSTAASLSNKNPQPSTSKLRFSETAESTLPANAEASRPNGYATRSRGAQHGGGKDKGQEKTVEMKDDSSDIEIVEERPSRSTSASAMGKGKAKGKNKASVEDPSDPNIIVLCPMCQGSFRNLALNLHLDKCDGTKPPTNGTRAGKPNEAWDKLWSSTGGKPSGTSSSGSKEKGAGSSPQFDTTKPLPIATYTGLKVSALKKKLEDLSLPTSLPPSLTSSSTDSKITFLRRRHQQWTTLWNANADTDPKSAEHKSHRELVKELGKWEEMMDGSRKVEIEGKAYSKAHESDFRTLIQQARESMSAKKQQQESAARAEELEGELGELREEEVQSASQGLEDVVKWRKEEYKEEEMPAAEKEEEQGGDRPTTRTSSTVRFAVSPPTGHRSTPPLSSPTPTTHTLPATRTPSSPTGSLSASPSPSPSPPPSRALEETEQQQEEEAERRKRKREFSPFDPRGPRPSQMVRGEEGWIGGLNAEDEDEDVEGEAMEE